MSWEIVKLQQNLGEYRDDWNRLNQELYSGHPFFDSSFIEPLLKYFGSGQERLCVHKGVDGCIDGLLILVRRCVGVWTLFLPSQAQIAPVLVRNVSNLNSLLPKLPGFSVVLELINQDVSYSVLRNREITFPVFRQSHVVTINTDVREPFESYWKLRSRKLKQNIRRYMKRIVQDGGEVRLVNYEQDKDFVKSLTSYGEIESKGWKGKAGTAIHIDNEQGAFYLSVLNKFSKCSKATIYELYIGDVLAASRLCIRNDLMLVMLKTTYDEEYAKYSLGRILLYLVLEREFALRRVKSVEFYTNAKTDQIAWSTGQRTIEHALLFRNKAFYLCYRFLQNYRATLAQRKKECSSSVDVDNQEKKYVFCKVQSIDSLPSSYLGLLEKVGKKRFDLDIGWFRHLADTALSESEEVILYGLETSSHGVAKVLLPLSKQCNKFGLKSLSTFYTASYLPIISVEQPLPVLTELFSKIQFDTPNTDAINLSPMPVDDVLYEATYLALKNAGWWPFRYFCFGNWYLKVEGRSYNDYYSTLPSAVRHTIERKCKRFFEQNNGVIEIIDSANKIDHAVAAYEKIYASSWKLKEPFPEFIPGLIRMYAEKGELRLGIAYVDHDPAAAQIWIVRNGKAAIYKLAYDEKYSNLSVGTILTGHLMKNVIDIDQVSEVDYLIGDDSYKKDWMSHRRECWGILAYNSRTLRGMAGICKEFIVHVLKKVVRSKRTVSNQV